MRLYRFIGPKNLLKLVAPSSKGRVIEKNEEIASWISETSQELDAMGQVTVTFVINKENRLLIAYRRSEHVACVGGEEVLSAGEMTFEIDNGELEVVHVTNQSTGYCPEPKSWEAVQKALNKIGIKHPGEFSIAYDFRKCDNCGAKVLIKEDWFYCYECDNELSKEWNF